jgi:hypothetical protein
MTGLLSFLQGPCRGNQLHFATNTELLETLNRMMRSKPRKDQEEEQEIEIKKTVLSIFQVNDVYAAQTMLLQ